jgi:hypothetical protein
MRVIPDAVKRIWNIYFLGGGPSDTRSGNGLCTGPAAQSDSNVGDGPTPNPIPSTTRE